MNGSQEDANSKLRVALVKMLLLLLIRKRRYVSAFVPLVLDSNKKNLASNKSFYVMTLLTRSKKSMKSYVILPLKETCLNLRVAVKVVKDPGVYRVPP